MTDIGMHRISKVDRSGTGRQFDNAPFRCENVNLIREQIGFHALDKFKRATCALLQFQQALHPALGTNLRGSTGFAVLFISPVRRDPHFGHLVHILCTDLDFNRNAVRTDHRRVQRLIAVRFWNGDVVFYPSRTRFIEAVHLAEHAIAGVGVMDDYAERIDIHDRMETLLFKHHLAIDGIEVLFTTTHTAWNSRFLQSSFDFREDFLDHLFSVAASGFNHLFNHAIAVRVQRLKTQLFKLGFNVMNT